MKRTAWISTSILFLVALSLSFAKAQEASLGNLARQVRKQKAQSGPTAKKFDNDNLPAEDKLSVVGPAPSQPSAAEAAAAVNNDGAPQTPNQTKATPAAAEGSAPGPTSSTAASGHKPATDADDKGDAQAQKQQLYDSWKKRIDDQKGEVDLLARELDVQNREYRMRAAAFYADAGNRLRNSGAWDKEDAQYKDQIAAKQKQLEDAKKKLEDMQEEARKSGVPSSVRE